MKENGFVTSALLYGILSLFLLLILGTISVIGSRKLANDKIKQSALDDVQALTTEPSCFEINNDKITGYNFEKCPQTVFIPEGITSIGKEAFKYNEGEYLTSVTIPSTVTEVASDAFAGQNDVMFILKNPNLLIVL